MGPFFKIFPILSQSFELKFKKILEKSGDFAQNLADWHEWVTFSQKISIFVWVYFQISRRYVRTKTKLEYPPLVTRLMISDLIMGAM